MTRLIHKSAVLRKLNSQFSYLRGEIPKTINLHRKNINSRERIDEIIEAAESQDLARVIPEMLELRKLLDRSFTDFTSKVKDSKINTSEVASQLEYYLGIKRAMEIIKGFSEGSLKPFRKDEEKASRIDDKKHWLDYLKRMKES